MKIAAIINYCTIEQKFINISIEQILPCVNEVIIPYCTHLYNGELENLSIIENTKLNWKHNSKVSFYEFNWEDNKLPSQYWVNYARKFGSTKISNNIDWVLYLDADEICDNSKFLKFISYFNFKKYDTLKLSNYWYFREPIYRAKQFEDSIVMVRKKFIDIFNCNSRTDREQLHESLPVKSKKKLRNIQYKNNTPMFHHYSWVRTQDEMIKKVINWGHNKDRNWIESVDLEFDHEFNGTNFINDYTFDTVENKFNIHL